MYKNLEEFRREAEEHFNAKDEEKVYDSIQQFVQLGSAAYDMDIIKRGYNIAALVAEVFKNDITAIKYYKKLRDVSEDD